MIRNEFLRTTEAGPVEGTAPCRIDMGGTLDIKTFYLFLREYSPCTFNIALDLRTTVRLTPHRAQSVMITSKGFADAEFAADKAPFNHPLGLMFAITAYFGMTGVHIQIDSSSPPRSALGGSSAAAVALISACQKALGLSVALTAHRRRDIVRLAHRIEESVAGVSCGTQDQLAAAYGGMNLWHWQADQREGDCKREVIRCGKVLKDFRRHFLIAYCGIPHESKSINEKWIRQFIAGRNRGDWIDIIECTRTFAAALRKADFRGAAAAVNKETAIRRNMTPEVLDTLGRHLVQSAVEQNCGARFTGAGGGGCLWAIGEADDIASLRIKWEAILSSRKDACLLDAGIDNQGVS